MAVLAAAGLALPVFGQSSDGGVSAVRVAALRLAQKDVDLTGFDDRAHGVEVSGHAGTHEAVAALMLSLASHASTPRGLARILERRRDRRTVRVELLDVDAGAIVELAEKDVSRFEVDLKTGPCDVPPSKTPMSQRIHFTIVVKTK